MQTFNEYQDFVKSMKAYPEKHAIVYPALGLVGEAGEISEKVKKWLRGDHFKPNPKLTAEENQMVVVQMEQNFKEAVLKELGDPLWYIASLADDLGYTLQDVVDANEAKLTSRKERGVLKGSGDDR